MSSLTASCLVCGHPAANHLHYGAVCCYSCRAFFRRSISQNYVCISGDNKCNVNKITRANCRRCRFNKCISVGMDTECVDVSKRWKKPDKKREDLEDDSGSHADPETSLDINDIVDNCFKEKHEKENQNDANKDAMPEYVVCTSQGKRKRKLSNIEIKVGINEKKHSSICFTIEEEFRIHDLIAKREFMNDIFVKIKSVDPKFVKDSVVKLKNGRKVTYGQKMWDGSLNRGQKIASSKFQDVFDEFSHVNRRKAFESYYKSFPALCALLQGISEATKDQSMVEQQKILGCSEKSVEKMLKICPGLEKMKGIGMEDQTVFVSPWALSSHDEDFFTETVRNLGELISHDISLLSIYQTLIMCSYNMAGEDLIGHDVEIEKVQNEMKLLLYRYLASKVGTEEASERVSVLMSYVEMLHRCGDILFNRMLWMGDDEEENVEIMETKLGIGENELLSI